MSLHRGAGPAPFRRGSRHSKTILECVRFREARIKSMTAGSTAAPAAGAQPISKTPPYGGFEAPGNLILPPRRIYLFFLGAAMVFVSSLPLIGPEHLTVQDFALSALIAALGLLVWRLCLYRALAVFSPDDVASDFLHAWRLLPWADVAYIVDLPYPGPFAHWLFASKTGAAVSIPISWSNVRRQDVRDYIHKYRPDLTTP